MIRNFIVNSSSHKPIFKYNNNKKQQQIKEKSQSMRTIEKKIIVSYDKLFNRNLTKNEYKILNRKLRVLYSYRTKLEKEIFWLFFEEE